MRPLFYDLTELLYLSRGFKSYYGIAKVVAAGAVEAFRSGTGARFVAYSQAHDGFFEIFPKADPTFEGGVDLNVPNSGLPFFTRRIYTGKRRTLHYVAPYLFDLIDRAQRRKWAKTGVSNPLISLEGGAWVSCARPKLMIHAIRNLKDRDVEVNALLHDVIPLYDEEARGVEDFNSSFHGDTNYVLTHADQIIANSEFTLSEINRFADMGVLSAPKSSSVAQLVHELRSGDEAPDIELPDRPYFLMVGTSLGRKNLDVVLDAIKALTDRGETPPMLILAGRRRKRTMSLLDMPDMAAVKPHILQIDSPNQHDLCRLYKCAHGVILPSHIEGWGLPAAEALWAGVPALCSDIPICREVCGEMGLYFAPDDIETLADQLSRLTHDPAFFQERKQIIEDNRGKLRTWRDFGRDLLDRVSAQAH